MAKRPIGVALVNGRVQTPTSTPSTTSKPSGTTTSTTTSAPSRSSGLSQRSSGGGIVYVPGQGGVSIALGGNVPSGAVTGSLGAAMAGASPTSAVTTTTYLAGTKLSSGGGGGSAPAPTSSAGSYVASTGVYTSPTGVQQSMAQPPSTLTGQFAKGNVITSVTSGGQSQYAYAPSLWGTIKQTASNVFAFGTIGQESFASYYNKVKEPTLEYFKSESNIYPNPVQWSGTQFGTTSTPFEYKDVSNLSPAQFSFQKDIEAFGMGMNPKYIGVYGDKAISQVSSDIVQGNIQAKINTGEIKYTGTEEETTQLQALAKQQYTEEFGKVQAVKAPTTQLIQTSEESKYFFGKGVIMGAEALAFYGAGQTEVGMALTDLATFKSGGRDLFSSESLTAKYFAKQELAALKATPIQLKLPSAELAKYEQGGIFRIFGERMTPYGLGKQEMNFALTTTKGTLGEIIMPSESGIPTLVEKGKTYSSAFIRGGESTTRIANPFSFNKDIMVDFTETFKGGLKLTQFGEGAVYKAILPSTTTRLSPKEYIQYLGAKGANIEFMEASGKEGLEYFGFIEKTKGGKYIETGLRGFYQPETERIVVPEINFAGKQEVIAHELIHSKTPKILFNIEDFLKVPYKLQPSEILAYGLEKGYAKRGFEIVSPEIKISQVFGEDVKSAVGTGYIKIGKQTGFTEFKLAGIVKETPESYLVAGGTPNKAIVRTLPSGELAPLKVRTSLGSYGTIAKLPEVEVGADYFSIQGTGAKTIQTSEGALIQLPKSLTGTGAKDVSLTASYMEQAAQKLLPTIETKGTTMFTGTGQLLKTSTSQKQQFYTGDLQMDFQQQDTGTLGGLIQIQPPIQVTPQRTIAGTWQPQVPREALKQEQIFNYPSFPTPRGGFGFEQPPIELFPSLMPPFLLPSFNVEGGSGRRYKKKKMKYKYQPSFTSLAFGITGKPQKFNVGGEQYYGSFRPIISSGKRSKGMKLPKMKGFSGFHL